MTIGKYVLEIKVGRVKCDPYFKSTEILNYIYSSQLNEVLSLHGFYYLTVRV